MIDQTNEIAATVGEPIDINEANKQLEKEEAEMLLKDQNDKARVLSSNGFMLQS